jgi:tetratricopeptide (TPR) repeat protein
VIILSGFEIYAHRAEGLIRRGNELFYQDKYDEAREFYEKALSIKAREKRINYNLGNISYKKADYLEALEFYRLGPDSPEKYLLMGSSIFFLAEGEEDPLQKISSYEKLLEIYKEGIIKYPQELRLKYNYEYIKKLLEELQSEQENESRQGEEDQDNENGNREKKNSNSNDEDSEHDERQNEQNGNEEQNEQDQDEKKDENEQDSKEIEKEGKQEEGAQEKGSSANQDSRQNLEEIKQILEMLEKAEEESLKNNQSIYRGAVKEEKYDW